MRLLSFLTLTCLAIPLLSHASEPSLFSILAWRGDEIVWLERSSAGEGDEPAFELTEAMQAQLAELNEQEQAAGLASFFPRGTSLKSAGIDAGRAMIVTRLPSASWPEGTAAAREAVSHLLGEWSNELPGVDAISLRLTGADGEVEVAAIDGAIRPISSKPEAAVVEDQPLRQAMSIPHAPGSGTAQPTGALSDASIFLNPGHGWFYSSNLGRWATQRGNLHQHIEDFGSGESVLQYLHQYLWNAGARIYTARERDLNTNMVIVDNGGAGYSETGSWSTETVSGAHEGDHRRATTVTGAATATARFTPDIPEAGHYAVYVWYRRADAGSPTSDAKIEIRHTGDTTTWVQDQNRDGFTWKYIGTYYFEEGVNPETGSVTVTNQSSIGGRGVVADAVRFGGGMGDIPDNVSGTISGKPRWEESGRYYAGFLGKSDWASSNQVSGMPRWAAWEHEPWEQGKSVYVSWHTNAGGGTGTETYSHSSPVAGSHQLRNLVHDQIIRDIRAAWDSGWADRGTKTANFGEVNPSNNDEMPATLIEVAFHDNATDTKYLLDPEFRRSVARAVYKGLVRFYASSSMPGFSNGTYLPEPPRNFHVSAHADGSIDLGWTAPLFSTGTTGLYGHAATGYRVYESGNGRGFNNGTAVTGTATTLTGFEPGEVVYLRVAATNAGGESFPTSTLAVRIPDASEEKVLIVNGFTRRDRFMNVIENDPYSANNLSRGYLDSLNTSNYIIQHAQAIQTYPQLVGFDSAEAAAIESNVVALTDYDAVIWMAGLQAHVNDIGTQQTPAFTPTLRSRLAQYRNEGGQLFLSGAEVAWDTNRVGQNAWMEAILKTEYVSRSASSYEVEGRVASILDGFAAQFDDGGGPVYHVEYPDVIAPADGATSALKYTGTSDDVVDGFDEISGWRQPGWSGSTNADPAGSFGIASNPVRNGTGSGNLAYEWGGSGTFIRVYNQSQPGFALNSDLSIWVYGDGSGHRLRLAVRDAEGELFVNPYTTIDFTGWRKIVWEDVPNNAAHWAGNGNGSVTGPTISLDSIQLSKTTGGPFSGDLYFDYAVASPVDAGEGEISTAAVQYDGEHKVVYLAFPFESITADVERADLMARTLDFFGFGLTPYETWQEEHFPDDPGISGELVDPYGDGVPNIVKYALNLDPREASRDGLPEVSIEEDALTLRYNQAKEATDIEYVVEVSDDLVSWESGEGQVELIETVDNGETWRVTVRDSTTFPESGRRFIRLRVSRL